MYNPISVCIPAYNEGRTISNTLDSIVNQTFPGDMEIIVCANGCTDNTAERVKETISKYPQSNIKLFETEEKGKPNAWNILRKEAYNNYIFFVDGDVTVTSYSIWSMFDVMINQGLVAVTAINVPLLDEQKLFTRLLTRPVGKSGGISGRLYCINNNKLDALLQKYGFTDMPIDIIHEDTWLDLIIGKRNFTVDTEANVLYVPYDWKEAIKMGRREARSIHQLNTQYSHLFHGNNNRESWLEGTKRRYKKLKEVEGFTKKIESIIGYILRSGIYYIMKKMVEKEKLENPLDGWETSEASKVPII